MPIVVTLCLVTVHVCDVDIANLALPLSQSKPTIQSPRDNDPRAARARIVVTRDYVDPVIFVVACVDT